VFFPGNPDVGKTTIACDLVARYTTGTKWPDESPNTVEPGEVLIMSAEDGAEDTLKPRLLAAGADVTKVHHVMGVRTKADDDKSVRMLALDQDMDTLRHHVEVNPQVGIIVIDPVTSYFGRADLNKEQEVRRILGPLKELCEETGVTLITLGHFNKRSDVGALHKVGGAVAMSGLPRAVWLFSKDPEKDGEYLMLLGKGNLSRKRSGLTYCFEQKQLSELSSNKALEGTVPFIAWGPPDARSADSVIETAGNPERKEENKAQRFLSEILANGRVLSAEVFESAKQAGIGRKAVLDAKKSLDIKSRQSGGVWYFVPPERPTAGAGETQKKERVRYDAL
jgi:hypothetical protein